MKKVQVGLDLFLCLIRKVGSSNKGCIYSLNDQNIEIYLGVNKNSLLASCRENGVGFITITSSAV